MGLTIESLRLLHGANYFSWEPVVWMRLNLGAYDEVFSNTIDGFPQRLHKALPSLYDHFCSPGVPGGFLRRVEEGTLLGHIIEHVAIELQQLAGMSVNFGKTRATETSGVYNVLFQFIDEEAGLYAATAAVELVSALVEGRDYPVQDAVERLIGIREERLLGPSTQALVDAAALRGIAYQRLDEQNLIQLGTGRFQQRLRATLTSRTGLIAYETALDKSLSLRLLADAAVPVPRQRCGRRLDDILAFFAERGAPLTLKPRQGVLGRGVTVGAATKEAVSAAFHWAQAVHEEVIAQETIKGHAFRLLTIDSRLAAAVRLDPPCVTGDGTRSVAQLLAALNADPRRVFGDKGKLSKAVLSEGGPAPDHVPAMGEIVPLQVSGAMKLGGAAIDVTELVHPETRLLVERASRIVGLDVAGIDVIAEDIARPLAEQGGAVIEVGAAPDFRPHLGPTDGAPRPVADLLVASLFPPGQPDHAFTISITGGQGSAEAAHWLARCLAALGRRLALATGNGLFAGAERLTAADASQPEYARIALRDPDADTIVLETELSGILRGGLGYGLADIGVVLNFAPWDKKSETVRLDHREDQAYAQSVVAEQVRKDGVAVLNADQYLVNEVRQRLQSPVIWFSRNPLSRAVRATLRRDGQAVLLEQGMVVHLAGPRRETALFPIAELNLAEPWQTDAALALSAVLLAMGVTPERLRSILLS